MRDVSVSAGYTPLHLAAMSGRTSAVTALIGMGADSNVSSRTGDTALHLACHGGHVTSVRCNLKYGVCFSRCVHVHCSHVKVETLVSENANCTMLNVSGHTPLDLACQSGHAQVHVTCVCTMYCMWGCRYALSRCAEFVCVGGISFTSPCRL